MTDTNEPLAVFDAYVEAAFKEKRLSDQTAAEDLKAIIKLAGRKLVEDSALELGTTAVDGVALTLLTIYREGAYDGGFISQHLDELAKILAVRPPATGDIE